MTTVLKDVNQNLLVSNNKYLILPKKLEHESDDEYSLRKDNDIYKGVYTVEPVDTYGDTWFKSDSDDSRRLFGNLVYEFHPMTGGRRRKSRRLRKRFRKTRK
jgi:hypothetical protein